MHTLRMFALFPPVNSGGLIEARTSFGWPIVAGASVAFPPVNSGGLIEACLTTIAETINTV